MNKIFKSFFNSNTGCFVVTSEAKSYASKGFKKQISSAIIVSALLTLSAGSFAEDYQNASNARVIGSFSNGQITFFDSNKTVNIKNLPNWNTDLTTKEGLNNRFHVDGNGNVLLTPYEPDSQILNDAKYLHEVFNSHEDERILLFDRYEQAHSNGGYVVFRELTKNSNGKFILSGEKRSGWMYGPSVDVDDFKNSPLLSELTNILDPEILVKPSTSNTNKEITLTRKLSNLSDGDISADSTDAINGRQIWELKKELGGSTEYLSVNATHDIAEPQTSAKAQGAHSLAIGENAIASGEHSLAIGTNAQIKVGVVQAVALGANSAVLQSDVLPTDINGVVSVGNSSSDSGFNRRIVNVANGVNDHDAATIGQLKSETSGFAKLDGSNINVDNGKWLTALGSTSANPIAQGNKHFVTGEQIAEETRVVLGKYITGGTTTVAQNLNNLDKAIDIVVQTKASKNELKDAFDFERNTTNANKVQNQARKAVTVASNDSLLQVSAGYGDTAGHYSLQLVKGSIADGTAGAGLVTGKTVFDYANQNLAAIDGSNIDPDNGQWLTKLGSVNGSAVSSGNTHFVSGAQVAAETRVGAKGNYILSENSAAANLQALDKGLGSVADAVGDKVNKSEVKDLVKVTNGSHTQVTSDDTPDGGVEYKVDVVADGLVADGNAGLVTGGAVKTAITNDIKAAFDFTTNTGNAHAVRDEARKAVTVSSANSTLLGVTAEADEAYHTTNYKLDVKTGAVSAANEALVTGKTVHDYIAGEKFAKVDNMGDYVAVADGQNTTVTTNKNGDKTTYSVNVTGNGAVEQGNAGLMTGGAVFTETRLGQDGHYVKHANSAAQNLSALDTQIYTNTEALKGKVNTSDVSTIAKQSVKVVGSGDNVRVNGSTDDDGALSYTVSVRDDGTVGGDKDAHLVTGTTVKAAIDTNIGNAFNFTSPVNTTYRNAVRDQAMEAVKVAADGPLTLSASAGTDHSKTYTLGIKAEGKIAADDKGLVTGGAVYDYVKDFTTGQGYVTTDGANIDVDGSNSKWLSKLGTQAGTAAVSDANNHFVTGKDVYEATHVTNDGNYVKGTNSVAANLAALDNGLSSKIGKDNLTSVLAFKDGKHVTVGEAVLENDKWTYAVDVKADGAVTAGNDALVTGGTVHNAVKDLARNDLSNVTAITGSGLTVVQNAVVFDAGDFVTVTHAKDNNGKFKVDLTTTGTDKALNETNRLVTSDTLKSVLASNESDIIDGLAGTYAALDANNLKAENVEAWQTKLKGEVAAGVKGFVTGDALHSEVRGTKDGQFIKTTESTASNLLKLDDNLAKVVDASGTLKVADLDLSNLSKAGSNVITGLSRQAITFQNGDFTVVEYDSDTGTAKFGVDSTGTDKTLPTTGNKLVTSTTLEAVLEAHDGTIGQTYATVTGDNIDVDGGQWLNKLGTKAGTQAISQANLHFVTGQEVFAETRVDTDGAFVKADASTKDNLKNLDRNLSVVVDANGTLKVAAMDLSNVTSITGNGLTAVRGAIEFADGDFVSVTHANDNEGKFKINLSTTGTDKTLTDDNRLVTSETLKSVLTSDDSILNGQFAALDASNIEGANLDSWRATLGSGAQGIGAGSKGFVTGEQIYNWATPVVTSRAGGFTFIDPNNSLGQNLGLIDKTLGEHQTALGGIQDQIDGINSGNSNLQTALDNLKQQLRDDLGGQGFIDWINSKVEHPDQGSDLTTTDKVEADNKNPVTSEGVYDYLHSDTIALGKNSTVTGEYGTAVGYNNTVAGNKSGAFGTMNSIASGADGSFVVGTGNKLEEGAKDTFVLGSGVTTGAKNAVVLGAGSEGVDNAVSVGASSNKRKIVNVADGIIAEGSSDAVTGGQLYETQQAIQENSRTINEVASNLHDEINRSAANSAAIAALHPLGLDEEHHWSAAAGVGSYGGEQAVSVGIFYKPTENFMMNLGASTATEGDRMFNAGVSYRFGAPSTYGSPTTSQLSAKVVALSNQNLALEAQLESSRSREENMAKKVARSQEDLEALRAEIEQMKKLLGLDKKEKAVKTRATNP